MPSDRVVEALDIVEYVGACCIVSLVVLMMHLLFLQTRPETLHRRVVVAVATTTYRRLHAKLFEQGSIRAAGVLGVFNRSSQQRVNLLMLSDLASPQMVFANQVFFEVGCLAQRQPHLARSLSSAIGQSLWESTDAAARSCFR